MSANLIACRPPVRDSRARVATALVAASLLTVLVPAALGQSPATQPTSQPALSGRLTQQGAVRVLEVWGDAAAAGYAHGYLLGEDIVQLFDAFVFDERVGVQPAVYESLLRTVQLRLFTFEPRFEQEFEGLLAGMHARLGPTINCRSLDRPLDLDDLKVVNVLSDLLGMGCATFAAWGSMTEGGRTLTARNLDYPSTPALVERQIVLAHRARENARSWVGVTWPGLIGAYTAMNADGVTISIHDVPGRPTTVSPPFTARSLTLRLALESAGKRDFVEAAGGVLRARHTIVGANVFVSGPVSDGASPAAVFEYDGGERDGGLTTRVAAADEMPALACTNHMRLRAQPSACRRYALLEERFGAAGRTKLDVAACLALLADIAQEKRLQTVHSVVFEPAERRMHVLLRGGPRTPEVIDVGALTRGGEGR